MNNWQSALDFTDLHTKYEAKELTVGQVAATVADQLAQNKFKAELAPLIKKFRALSRRKNASEDQYNDLLNLLYDFGDVDRRIWIRTF